MNSKSESAFIASLIAVCLVASCGLAVLSQNDHDGVAGGLLPAFQDRHQIQDYVQGTQGGSSWADYAAPTSGAQATAAEGVRHSTTNVQVEGVDEADCVKTDGEFLFIASYDTVSILRAYPVEHLSNASSLNIRQALGLSDNYSAWIQGIYLSEGKLVVIASINGPYDYHDQTNVGGDGYRELSPAIWRMPEERAAIAVFSIADAGSPSLLGWAAVSGYGVTSRMSGGVAYLVSQHYIWTYDSTVTLPKEWQGNDSSDIPATSVRYDPECHDPSSFLNILALDVGTMESNLTSILTGYASTIYVSTQAMYLTFQKWSVDSAQEARILVNGSGDATSVSSDSVHTTIYKIALDGLRMEPAARGDVPGYLLNQFSLDENGGLLRMATTFSWENQRNAVYVLDGGLTVIGALEDLAPGERIYSCRFMGDTLYLVTFRQVDPLFVIDLGDPTSPHLLGALKVPGFSTYLHPVGDGRLVGIGMENGSVKLSLFDVSIPSLPKELDTVLVPGWSYSDALWDHKAVTYDGATGSLVIPVTAWDQTSWNCTSGAYVFDVGEDELALRGAIEPGDGEYAMRAAYIGDSLYTVSDTTVYVNSLLDLSPMAKLVYKDRFYNYLPWLMAEGDVVAIGAAV